MGEYSNNDKVDEFLISLSAIDKGKFETVNKLRQILFETHPNISEKIMYGGIVFFSGKDMFSGVFVYKEHVSIEFSNGYLMNDPDHKLEGKGKFRRHLKIKASQDLSTKDVSFFVSQALD